MAYFVTIDYCILIGTTLISLFIGIYFVFKKKEKTSSEFLTGNQNMSVLPVVFSMLASDVSYNLIAFSMEVYTKGTQIFMTVAAEFVAIAIAAKIFLPIYLKVDGISVNQYLLSRFKSEKLVVITSLIMTISLIPELGVILFSPSLALGVATGMNAQSSILFTAAVVTLYTVFGGMNAIIYTDVVLFVLMMAGLFTVLIK
ncbi:sodium-coupled monocarboxylate transporter 1-like protein, partial [Leptotrombidium deliense]